MMTVLFTCPECGSGIHVHPSSETPNVHCEVCQHEFEAKFTKLHEEGKLEACPQCERKDFYRQKDFNRALGVLLFLIPCGITLFVGLLWGIGAFFVFWMLDFFLFSRLRQIAICYNCATIFRSVENIKEISDFNHEMHDRIVYSGQDFEGKTLKH